MADLVIEVCEGRSNEPGAIDGVNLKICNLVDVGKTDIITKKYCEAMEAYKLYETKMGELQALFEQQIGKAFIMIDNDRPTLSLEQLAGKYGVDIHKDLSDGAV